MNPANGLARVVFGGGGHGAGVEDHQFGFRKALGGVQTLTGERGFESCAVGLGCPASEIVDIKALHCFNSTNRLRES